MTAIRWIVALTVVVQGMIGCGGSKSVATAPSPVPAPPATSPGSGSQNVMSGTVEDTAFRSLAGVKIEVLDGQLAGSSTTTDAGGRFGFTGGFDDDTRFKASLDGYAPSVRTLQPYCEPCNPHRWINFELQSLATPVDMAGDYSVTFAADPSCTALPAEARTRIYEATIPPAAGQQITVPLRGGTFIAGWDRLPMGVVADYVAFWLEIVVERLAPDTYVTFNAFAAGHVDSAARSTFTFPLDGSISYCVTASAAAPYEDCFRNQTVRRSDCTSGQLILKRR